MHDLTQRTRYKDRMQKFHRETVFECSCGATLESNTEVIEHIMGTKMLPVPYDIYPNQ